MPYLVSHAGGPWFASGLLIEGCKPESVQDGELCLIGPCLRRRWRKEISLTSCAGQRVRLGLGSWNDHGGGIHCPYQTIDSPAVRFEAGEPGRRGTYGLYAADIAVLYSTGPIAPCHNDAHAYFPLIVFFANFRFHMPVTLSAYQQKLKRRHRSKRKQ